MLYITNYEKKILKVKNLNRSMLGYLLTFIAFLFIALQPLSQPDTITTAFVAVLLFYFVCGYTFICRITDFVNEMHDALDHHVPEWVEQLQDFTSSLSRCSVIVLLYPITALVIYFLTRKYKQY